MDDVALSSAEVVTQAEHAEGLRAYQEAGLALAHEIGNRGPLRLTGDGKLHPDILARFREHGYYVFEGVIDAEEIEELRRDANGMIERAPVNRDATVDKHGQPALGIDYARSPYRFSKPLGDPWGGTRRR